MNTKKLVRAGMIGALYAVFTIALAPISYGVVQVRIAEALTVLPFIYPEAILGLFIGCIAANIFGGLGFWDIGLGSLATLIAAIITAKTKNENLAPLPPVVINGIIVGTYLSILLKTPVLITMGYVAAGEAIACYLLGLPLLKYLRRHINAGRKDADNKAKTGALQS